MASLQKKINWYGIPRGRHHYHHTTLTGLADSTALAAPTAPSAPTTLPNRRLTDLTDVHATSQPPLLPVIVCTCYTHLQGTEYTGGSIFVPCPPLGIVSPSPSGVVFLVFGIWHFPHLILLHGGEGLARKPRRARQVVLLASSLCGYSGVLCKPRLLSVVLV